MKGWETYPQYLTENKAVHIIHKVLLSFFIISPMLSARKKKDGSVNITIYLFHNNTRTKALIKTDHYIHEQDWTGKVKESHPHHSHINQDIEISCKYINRYWLKNKDKDADQVKAWFELHQ